MQENMYNDKCFERNFEIDIATGFPICPKTRKVIDETVSYCK